MKKLIALIAITCLMVGSSIAQVVMSKVEDASVAYRVLNGYTGTLTIVVSGPGGADSISTNVVTCDGNATTLVVTNGTTTISELVGRITACTNAAGANLLTVDSDASLATDTIAQLNGTYTAVAGKWLEVLWDTSAALHYDLYIKGGQYGSGSYKLAKVTAYPGGTGNVTMSIYQSGVLIARQVYTSPVYVNPATWINSTDSTNTYGVVNDVTIDWPLNIRSLGAQPVIIRAARATTATTGVIAAIIE